MNYYQKTQTAPVKDILRPLSSEIQVSKKAQRQKELEEVSMNTKALRALLLVAVTAVLISAVLLSGCQAKKEANSVAVFVPGVVAGSPTYEMLVEGAKKAVKEKEEASIKIIEGGFNQGEWFTKVRNIAQTAQYDLIVTSNPAMPEICQKVSEEVPEQKFLVMDGYLKGNNSIFTFRFNQFEQAYLSGYFAGLVLKSGLTGKGKAGIIAGQEYPDMNKAIKPGFKQGVKDVTGKSVDFRVVGNWYDATKASELARNMYSGDVGIILTIAGGANQGVVQAAKNTGEYVNWFDVSGYDVAPGVVLGSTQIDLARAAYEKTTAALNGSLNYGNPEIVGVEEGYVTFVTDSPVYKKHVPESIRNNMNDLLKRMESGELSFPMPK